MYIYKEIESILNNVCKPNFSVLEIGGVKGGYLSSRQDISLIVSNINEKEDIDIVIDATNIPLKAESQDLIFMVAADYFIKDIEKAHKEFSRVLREGGHLIIASYKEETLTHLKDVNKKTYNIESYVYSENDYVTRLKSNGLTVEVKNIINNPPSSLIKRIVWFLLPRNKKITRSPWKIYICQKKND